MLPTGRRAQTLTGSSAPETMQRPVKYEGLYSTPFVDLGTGLCMCDARYRIARSLLMAWARSGEYCSSKYHTDVMTIPMKQTHVKTLPIADMSTIQTNLTRGEIAPISLPQQCQVSGNPRQVHRNWKSPNFFNSCLHSIFGLYFHLADQGRLKETRAMQKHTCSMNTVKASVLFVMPHH